MSFNPGKSLVVTGHCLSSASSKSELSIDCASDSTDVGTKVCLLGHHVYYHVVVDDARLVPGYMNAYTGRSPGT